MEFQAQKSNSYTYRTKAVCTAQFVWYICTKIFFINEKLRKSCFSGLFRRNTFGNSIIYIAYSLSQYYDADILKFSQYKVLFVKTKGKGQNLNISPDFIFIHM